MNTNTHLIKRAALKARVFAILAERRPHLAGKMTRVSGEFIDQCEGHLVRWLERELDQMPTTGKTVRLGFQARAS